MDEEARTRVRRVSRRRARVAVGATGGEDARRERDGTRAARARCVSGATLAACAVLVGTTHASPVSAGTMYVGAGDAAFLEREYDDLRYAGVTDVAPGTMDGRRGVRVEYDDAKTSFEALMRTYWRHCEPGQTNGQFGEIGSEFAPVVYAANASELAIAENARANLEASKIFGDMPLTVEIKEGAPKTFEESSERNALKTNPKKYEKMAQKRQARFKDLWGFVQFCADRVCGYVRFAPRCVGRCLAVFPEYEARNAGIPDLDGKNIKITAR